MLIVSNWNVCSTLIDVPDRIRHVVEFELFDITMRISIFPRDSIRSPCKFIRIETMCAKGTDYIYWLCQLFWLCYHNRACIPIHFVRDVPKTTPWWLCIGHILNLFKINWIHRGGFQLCMIAYESFPNVFTEYNSVTPFICQCAIYFIYMRNVLFRKSAIVVGQLECKSDGAMNMEHIINSIVESIEAFSTDIGRWSTQMNVSTVFGYHLRVYSDFAIFKLNPMQILHQLMSFQMGEMWYFDENWKQDFDVRYNLMKRPENRPKNNHNCIMAKPNAWLNIGVLTTVEQSEMNMCERGGGGILVLRMYSRHQKFMGSDLNEATTNFLPRICSKFFAKKNCTRFYCAEWVLRTYGFWNSVVCTFYCRSIKTSRYSIKISMEIECSVALYFPRFAVFDAHFPMPVAHAKHELHAMHHNNNNITICIAKCIVR